MKTLLPLFVHEYFMKKSLIFFLFTMTPLAVFAQMLMNRDSLLKLLPHIKEDSNTVLLYINIGQQYESNEPTLAKSYYLKAGRLSRKINYPRGVIKYINNYTFVLNLQGMYDSSLLLNLQAVSIAREIKDSVNLGKALFNTGTSYRVLEEYENATKYYEEGKKIFEKFGNEDIARGDDILQLLYYQMRNFDKAIELGEKSVIGMRKINDRTGLGLALNNLGLSYSSIRKLDRAAALFKEALQIGKAIGDKNMQANPYLNLGDISLQKGEYEELKHYMDSALVLSKELKMAEGELTATMGLSFYYTYKKDFTLAEQLSKMALSLSYRLNLKSQRVRVFAQLSNLAYVKQNMPLGEYYAAQSTLLGDSLRNESIQKNTLELEKKYEFEKKESRIQKLEADRKVQELSLQRRGIFNYILITGIVVLGIISFLLYRTYRQKQRLQQQRISELETEKQLTATEAVLKGEEQERTRLAKDLHDGLGGMLSGIKYSFNTMKENLIMTPDNHLAFERSMDMLDSSIKEMRRVAHNMMPETLVRFGLDTALKDFCNDINQSGALVINYHSGGLANENPDQTTAITIYRIVQELINNTLKHAAAKTAIVQITKTDRQLAVTVEDDGKGFDTIILKQSKGIGWSNIQHRVDFLKGKLDVDSRPQKGTSVHIEFNV